MFRSLPADVQIDDDGKCRSCGSRVDPYSRYGVWMLGIAVFLPGWFALASKSREWSIEYLPDLSGWPIPQVVLACFGVILVAILLRSWNGTSVRSNWLSLLFIPMILVSQVADVRHDPTWIAKAVDRLDQQTARLVQKASNGSFAAGDLQMWFDWHARANRQLEASAGKLGSIRLAVYTYAIDATTAFVFLTGDQKSEHEFFHDLQQQFLKRANTAIHADEIESFVRCYREADRKGISHRGVLNTEPFTSCFEGAKDRS